MTTQTVSGRRYFTKAWLMEQKSLIALLVLIAIVSTLSPNFFTINNLFNILQQTSVNIELASFMTPPLTTIHQPKDELGELAIDVLIHRITQPTLQQQRLQLTPILMERGSA